MVDFSVLPKARPAPEVYSDIRGRARVLNLTIVLFPFYFADMRRRSPTQDGGVGLNIAIETGKDVDSLSPSKAFKDLPEQAPALAKGSPAGTLSPSSQARQEGLLSGILKYNSASCKQSLWQTYFSKLKNL